VFTVCNVALDSIVSDMFGKSATAITDHLTSDEDFDAQHSASLVQLGRAGLLRSFQVWLKSDILSHYHLLYGQPDFIL